MDDNPHASGEMTAPAPSNPAWAAATAEYQKVMTDPTHPHHAGLKRGDKVANEYIDNLYRKAVPNTPPIDDRHGLSITTGGPDDPLPTLSPEDAQSVEVLRQEWGDSFETHLSEARYGAHRLTQHLSASVDDLVASVLDAGGELKLILKIASHYEQRMRGHEHGSRP